MIKVLYNIRRQDKDMLRVAICDDEEYFRIREKTLISQYMEKHKYEYQTDVFSSGKELLYTGESPSKYDVIFLDVNMDEIDGIEIAKKIRELTNEVFLVFITGFVTYALEGYKVDAIRYILKDDDCLEKTIAECMDAILLRMNYVEEKELFVFKEGQKEISIDDIQYIESNLHRLIFHMKGADASQYNMYEKLDVIEKRLEAYQFCRIHKSYLVNLKYMNKIERYQVELSDGVVLNIAKPRYPEVRKQYISYRGDL